MNEEVMADENFIIDRPSLQTCDSPDVIDETFNFLKVRFPNLKVPSSSAEWHNLYESAKLKSAARSFSYEEHLCAWIVLIKLARQNEDIKLHLIDCYCNAIAKLPIKAIQPDNLWVVLVNGVYKHIMEEEISSKCAKKVLDIAESKFKNSPKNAKTYWQAVFKNEKTLMKAQDATKEEQQRRFTSLWINRFSNPYENIDKDYVEFAQWANNTKLDKDIQKEVKLAFLNLSKTRKISMLIRVYELLMEGSKTTSNQALEDWAVNVFDEPDVPSFDFLEVVFDELLCEEPDCFFYYWICIHTLSNEKLAGDPRRAEKLLSVIKRGHTIGKKESNSSEQTFLQMAPVIASQCLEPGSALEVIESSLTRPELSLLVSPPRWFARSRGVLMGVSNLIHLGKIDHSKMEEYFHRAIKPYTMDFFKYNIVPQELAGTIGYETQLVELVKLFVSCQKSICNHPWSVMIKIWTEIFLNNSNPIMCCGYVDFVKEHGKPAETLEALDFAIRQVQVAENNEISPRLSTKRCMIRLLQKLLEVYSSVGNSAEQVNTSKMLNKKLMDYSLIFPNKFNDLVTPGLITNGFYPYGSAFDPNEVEKEKTISELDMTSSNVNSDVVIAKRLESLKVTPENDLNLPTRIQGQHVDAQEYRVFVSNIKYDVSEAALMKIFRDRGYPPIKVEIKRTKQGLSRGMGTLMYRIKEHADAVVKHCDKIKILGRTLFVSQYHPSVKQIADEKKTATIDPTVISLFNLSPEWNDQQKIQVSLSCYGHVKEITINETDESIDAKVEFHMTEDAKNAFEQISENRLFGDSVLCRLGYKSSSKRPVKNKKNLKSSPIKSKKQNTGGGDAEHMMPEITVVHRDHKTEENLKPEKNLRLGLVPLQAMKQNLPNVVERKSMKPRLALGGKPSTSTSFPSETMNKRIVGEKSTLKGTGLDVRLTSDTGSPNKVMRMTITEDVNEHKTSTTPPNCPSEDSEFSNNEVATKYRNNEYFKKLFEKQ